MDPKALLAKELQRKLHRKDMEKLRRKMGYELRKLFQAAELLPGDRGYKESPKRVFSRSDIARFLNTVSKEIDFKGNHLVYIEVFDRGTEGIYCLELDSDPSTWSPDDFVQFLRGGICN